MAHQVLVNNAGKKEKRKNVFKEACLVYKRMKVGKGVRAGDVCDMVGTKHNLSPHSKLKPTMVKKYVREDRAGQSPEKRGRKSKIPSPFEKAIVNASTISQNRGGRTTEKDLAKTAKSTAMGTEFEYIANVRNDQHPIVVFKMYDGFLLGIQINPRSIARNISNLQPHESIDMYILVFHKEHTNAGI